MNDQPVVTLVTAATQNYFWGLYLLAASVERWGLGHRLLIFHTGLDAPSERWLEQFPRVELRLFTRRSAFGLHCRKAEAMLEAGGDYIGWLDSDCLVIGDLNPLLVPVNGELQARLRTPGEVRSDFRRFYAPGEPRRGIPAAILDRWRRDVGERTSPRLDATVPSNVLVIHARFKPFLSHWDRQMQKVLDPAQGTLDRRNPAYYLADESVLNSLLAFGEWVPQVGEYRLAPERRRHLAHFMGSPKPWVRWSPRNLYCLPFVFELIEWVRQQGRSVPPLPPSLRASRRTWSIIEAHAAARLRRLRSLATAPARRLRERRWAAVPVSSRK